MGTNSEDQPGVFPGPLGSRCSRRLPCATWCPIPATAQKPRVRKCLQPNYAPWFRPTLANREGGGGAGESESPITSRFPRIRRGLGFTTLGLSAALITFSKDWKAHSGWRRRLARSYSAATVRGGGGYSSQVPCVTAPCCLLSSCPCCCCWFGDWTRAQVALPLPLPLLRLCLSRPPSPCPPEASWRPPPARAARLRRRTADSSGVEWARAAAGGLGSGRLPGGRAAAGSPDADAAAASPEVVGRPRRRPFRRWRGARAEALAGMEVLGRGNGRARRLGAALSPSWRWMSSAGPCARRAGGRAPPR